MEKQLRKFMVLAIAMTMTIFTINCSKDKDKDDASGSGSNGGNNETAQKMCEKKANHKWVAANSEGEKCVDLKATCLAKAGFKWDSTKDAEEECVPKSLSENIADFETAADALKTELDKGSSLKADATLLKKVEKVRDLLAALSKSKEDIKDADKTKFKNALAKIRDGIAFETGAIFAAGLKAGKAEQQSFGHAIGKSQALTLGLIQGWGLNREPNNDNDYSIALGNSTGQHDLATKVAAFKTALDAVASKTNATAAEISAVRTSLLDINPIWYKFIKIGVPTDTDAIKSPAHIVKVEELIGHLKRLKGLIEKAVKGDDTKKGGNLTQSIAALSTAALADGASDKAKKDAGMAQTSGVLLVYYTGFVEAKYLIGKVDATEATTAKIDALIATDGPVKALKDAVDGGNFDLNDAAKSTTLLKNANDALDKLRSKFKKHSVLFAKNKEAFTDTSGNGGKDKSAVKISVISLLKQLKGMLGTSNTTTGPLSVKFSQNASGSELANATKEFDKLKEHFDGLMVAYGVMPTDLASGTPGTQGQTGPPSRVAYLVPSAKVNALDTALGATNMAKALAAGKKTVASASTNDAITVAEFKSELDAFKAALEALKVASTGGSGAPAPGASHGYNASTHTFAPTNSTDQNSNNKTNSDLKAEITTALNSYKTKRDEQTHGFNALKGAGEVLENENPTKTVMGEIDALITEIEGLWNPSP